MFALERITDSRRRSSSVRFVPLRQFDRVLVTSGLRPIPEKRVGTSQNVPIAKVAAQRSRPQ
jgi:hypothetical protein